MKMTFDNPEGTSPPPDVTKLLETSYERIGYQIGDPITSKEQFQEASEKIIHHAWTTSPSFKRYRWDFYGLVVIYVLGLFPLLIYFFLRSIVSVLCFLPFFKHLFSILLPGFKPA